MRKTIFVLLISTMFIFVFYNSAIGSKDLSKRAELKQELTEVQKLRIDNIDKMVGKSWSEIKQVFKVDKNKYFQVDISNLPAFANGEGPIQDKDTIQSILINGLNPYLHSVPKGSLLPLILIKFDGSEVLFGYKESDGTNVLKQSSLENGKWVHKPVKKEKGEKVPPPTYKNNK